MDPQHQRVRSAFVLALGLGLTAITSWAASDVPTAIRWKSGDYLGAAAAKSDAQARLDAGPSRHVVAQFDEALTASARAKLRDAGVEVLRYLDANAYFAKISGGEAGLKAAQDAGLARALEIRPEWKLHPKLLEKDYPPYCIFESAVVSEEPAAKRDASTEETGVETLAAYVIFQADVDLDQEAVEAIERVGGMVRSYMRSINALVAWIPLANLPALASEDIVEWIEPPLPPFEANNDSNRVITQTNTINAAPYNLDGSGVTVLVYDAGTAMATHLDFGGRLTVYDSSGTNDHPTHVAGTIGGSGARSAQAGGTPNQWRGMAPAVTMASYGFEYDGTGVFLYTNPGDIEQNYDRAINDHGAMISNNSIGTNVAPNGFPCEYEGDYGATSMLIDAIVRGSLGAPMRIVWANGNERGPGTCGSTYHTTAPPACAKNHITVGALNSNNDSMTSFSSWGPTDDGRLKPDICAPGCQSNSDYGVTSTWIDGSYDTICGTSMAAPTVTGIGALILQDWMSIFPGEPLPPNAMLKVLFAHNAADLGNPGPDYKFGYGSVRAQNTIDFLREGSIQQGSIDNGQIETLLVDVLPGSAKLKITMAWDDPPGAANTIPELVNNLDLVAISPSGITHFPWTLDPANPALAAVRNQPDSVNNIEQVVVDAPQAGVWQVLVTGTAVPDGPQTYSLAATPDLIGCSSSGIVSLNSSSYGCSSTALVTVKDCDLNVDPVGLDTIIVGVTSSSEPSGENLLLTEVSPNAGTFEGPIVLSSSDAPGVLLVDDGDTLAVVYHDDDDGSGVSRDVTDSASVDCSPPVFAGLSSVTAGPGRVDLSWNAASDTSGPVTYNIYRDQTEGGAIGELVGSTTLLAYSDSAIGPDQDYFYVVRAQDALGYEDTNTIERGVSTQNWIIIGNGADDWGYPMYTYYHDARSQVIYLASEIGGPCSITSLALDVTSLPAQTMNNWTIRMKHTTLASYGPAPAWEADGWTIGYQANETVSTGGWVIFEFTTPFQFNGSDNLLVDFSFNNEYWTFEGYCKYTNAAVPRTIYEHTDSEYGDPLDWSGTTDPEPNSTTKVPNLMLFVEPPGLVVTPETEFEPFGPQGGPFAPSSTSCTLENLGEAPIEWSASVNTSWLAVMPYSGTLNPGASMEVSILLTNDAESLPAGVHTSTVAFTDITNGRVSAHDVVLSVLSAISISTIEELQNVGGDPSYPLDGTYVLTQDIDASGSAAWNNGAGFDPIGSEAAPFTGTFFGAGHVLSGLVINRPSENYVGVFAVLGGSATVSNLGIEDCAVAGAQHVAGLAGETEAGCIVSGCSATGAVTGTQYVGALVGQNLGALTQCHATGAVTATANHAGGLAGWNTGQIAQSYAVCDVTSASYAGGLVGYNAFGSVSECYAAGPATGGQYVGGLAGRCYGGPISRCYATGVVTGTTDAGGLVGLSVTGNVTASFWDTETSGMANSSGGTGLPTSQMQAVTTFTNAGWDFTSVWYMLTGGSYPYLSDLPQSTVPDLSGMNETDAIAALEDTGLTVQVSYAHSDVVPEDQVISQSLPGGANVNAGATVYIIISLGAPAQVIVPDVVGQSQGDAETALISADLTLGAISYEHSDSVPAGHVISQNPLAGAVVFADSPVDVVVSLGPQGAAIPIASITQLQAIGQDPNYPLDGTYVLSQDIDASPTQAWNNGAGFDPIGTSTAPFAGSFDAQGYVITGLVINRPGEDYVALFAVLGASATVSRLGFEECAITGAQYVACLAGKTEAGSAVSHSHATGSVTGTHYVGGLVGQTLGSVSQSYAVGSVTAATSYAGGLTGWNTGQVYQCYAICSVTGTVSYAGGLLGYNAFGTTSQCYATGAVSGGQYVGGLAGRCFGGPISQSYSTGAVTGASNAGGLVGLSANGTVTSSFWDTETSGMSTSSGGTGLPTAQMHTLNTYTGAGWDFDTVWYMLTGGSYPYLSDLPQSTVPDLSGMNEAGAVAALENAGLTVQVSYAHSYAVPAGLVASQSIPAGEHVNAWTEVHLVVSLGPQPVLVPNVVGMPQGEAETTLTAGGLIVGTITEQYNETVPAGNVISQNPVAGTEVLSGSAVQLTISLGPEPAVGSLRVDILPGAAAFAGARWRVDGGVWRVSGVTVSGLEAGTHLISYNTIAGWTSPPGEQVTVSANETRLATGVYVEIPEPVSVPDVVGLSRSNAEAAITASGLAVGSVTEQYSPNVPAGNVMQQNPAGGAQVLPGTAVHLVVSRGPQPVSVPNVVGLPRSEAETALTAATLIVGAVTEEPSATVPAGNVISQAPAGGTQVLPGSAVSLVVSLGPAAPVAVNDSYAVCAETPLMVTSPGVLSNDSDPQDDALTALHVAGPNHGELTLNPDGSFEYTPDPGYAGPDSFAYRAYDGGFNSNVATVTITVMACVADIAASRSFWYPAYASPGIVDITVTVECQGAEDLTDIAVSEELPTGWTFDSLVDFAPLECGPATVPSSGATGVLEFRWLCTPEFPCSFTYRVAVPLGQAGQKAFAGELRYRRGSGPEQTEPITCLASVVPRLYHSLDYAPADGVLGASEVLRLIQYFDQNGYHCAFGTEDGYDAGSSGTVDPCCVPHQSDYNPQDWHISLPEVLRAVQLFNFGAYHVEEGTEDGYAPGTVAAATPVYEIGGEAIELSSDKSLPALYATRDIAENGEVAEITVTFTGVGAQFVSALGLIETLPEGWTFDGLVDATEAPAIAPREGDSGALNFAWLWTPDLPACVIYRARKAPNAFDVSLCAGEALYRTSGSELRVDVVSGPPQMFHVDATAATQGDGTDDLPFRTIAEAIDASVGGRGDTIMVYPGTYCENSLTLKPATTLLSEGGPYRTHVTGLLGDITLITATEGCVIRGLGFCSAESAVRVGGGMHVEVTNCVFHSNQVGLLAEEGASVVFVNNTVYSNSTCGVLGGSSVTFESLANNVFADNATALSAPPASIQHGGYNDWFGNSVDCNGPPASPTDLFESPLFVDVSVPDLRLDDDSPCRDAGDPAEAFLDIDGTRNDIGAEGGPYGIGAGQSGPGTPAGPNADVNGDGSRNAIDIQLVVNAALGLLGEHNCDIDGSGQVNAIDIQTVILQVLQSK